MTTEATIPVNCGRCAGSGRYGPIQVQNGICFKCGGAGILGYTTQAEIDRKARAATKRAEARERARARRREKQLRLYDALLAADPELKQAFLCENRIVMSIAQQARQKGTITDRQRDAAINIAKQEKERAAQETERRAGLTDLEAGKQEITGTILNFKDIESQYGLTVKMLVQLDNGNRLFGTCPRSLLQVERGSKVVFTATVEPKEKGFGFFSRPTKARLVG
jgi:hypothetical protein